MPRVKLAQAIEREIIEDKIPKAVKKKRGRPPGSKNVKSSKKGSKKSKNKTEADEKEQNIHTDDGNQSGGSGFDGLGGPPYGPPGGHGGKLGGPPGGHYNEQGQGGNSVPAEPNRNQGADLGIASSREIWVETKADGGKSYYCNATTGVTQWTVPQGEDVKVLTQDEAVLLQKKIQESGEASKDDGDEAGEDLQEKIQESGSASKDDGEDLQESEIASKDDGEKDGEDPQEKIQESEAASKDDGEKDGEDLQEEESPEEDHEPTCDWSEHTSGAVCSGKKYYYNRKTGKSVWEKPQELKDFESRVPEFHQHSRHQVHNQQGHSDMPRNDGVPLNLPIQGQLIQTRPSVVQQVPSQPAHGPLSAQDQHQALLSQGQQLLPAATARGHPQVHLTQGHYNIKIKIQVEIDMSTEQFISVGQALFRRNRH